MKKFMAVLLSSLMVLSMAACGKKDETEKKKKSKKDKETTEQTEDTEDTEETDAPTSADVDLSYELYPDEQVEVIKQLISANGGLEVCYTLSGFRTIYAGGKDDRYWFMDLQESGDYELYYTVIDNGEMIKHYFNKVGDTILYEQASDDALELMAEYFFFGQERIKNDLVTPSEVDNNGIACDRFSYDMGSIAYDIARDFGITARYSNIDDTSSSFELGYLRIGGDVEVLELPEGQLGFGDIDSIDYWANKFDFNVCPFTITKGSESKDYYFRNGGSLVEWLRTEMNTDGWYFYQDMIISKDGKWAIPQEEYDSSFSSFCEYVAVPYDGPTLSEEEQAIVMPSTLYALHSWTPFFAWSYNGIFVESDYRHEDVDMVFGKDGLDSDFHTDSDIFIYIGERDSDEKELLDGHAQCFIIPHKDIKEYNGFIDAEEEVNALCVADYNCKGDDDVTDYDSFVYQLSIGEDYHGDVDVIFTYEGVIAYYFVGTIA